MLEWVPLLAAAALGWRLARGTPSGATLLGAPALGLAVATAMMVLLSQVASNSLAALLSGFALAGSAVSLRESAESQTPRSPNRTQLVLLGCLTLWAWIYALVRVQLFPTPDFLLHTLPDATSTWSISRRLLGSDPWASTLLLLGLTQVAVVWGSFDLAQRALPHGRFSATVLALFLLGSASNGWLVYHHPEEALTNLWVLAVLRLQLTPNRIALGLSFLPILALALEGQGLWSVALVTTFLHYRGPALRVVVLVSALSGLLFGGPSAGWLAGLVAVWLTRRSRPGLQQRLGLLALWMPTHSALGFAALAFLVACRLTESWKRQDGPGRFSLSREGLRVPRRAPLVASGTLLFLIGLLPAEKELNHWVLIGAQKERANFLALSWPRSLEDWLASQGTAFGVQPEYLERVDQIAQQPEPLALLTRPLPDPRVSSLLALGRTDAMTGWFDFGDGPKLDKALALYLFTNDPKALDKSSAATVFPLDAEPLSAGAGTGNPVDGALVVLEGPQGDPLTIEAPLTASLASSQPRRLRAAALVPVRFVVKNPNSLTLDLSRYRAVRVVANYLNQASPRLVEQPRTPVELGPLEPGASVELTAYLRTDYLALDYSLGLHLIKPDGSFDLVPMAQEAVVRSFFTELPVDVPYGVRQ